MFCCVHLDVGQTQGIDTLPGGVSSFLHRSPELFFDKVLHDTLAAFWKGTYLHKLKMNMLRAIRKKNMLRAIRKNIEQAGQRRAGVGKIVL
jgi:hypothetical protein